jgi:hypothetical protein
MTLAFHSRDPTLRRAKIKVIRVPNGRVASRWPVMLVL